MNKTRDLTALAVSPCSTEGDAENPQRFFSLLKNNACKLNQARECLGMTSKHIKQIAAQLALISVSLTGMELIRADKSTLDVKAIRFGKYEERLTVSLDSKGDVKKGSVRFYGARDSELN